ncbi:hypothetical protein WN48_04814 [Eufriesea mexicana]|uniref:Uncharacterized protein n=1 Tax=Eufriesea mexicana TaxID=516756 RepID=A0A310SE09_9HYME|nr:hypothetical protein WN48_04814 [Eufriesea mexicana]
MIFPLKENGGILHRFVIIFQYYVITEMTGKKGRRRGLSCVVYTASRYFNPSVHVRKAQFTFHFHFKVSTRRNCLTGLYAQVWTNHAARP